jgi:DNA-binding MarR family transcriptional regulator
MEEEHAIAMALRAAYLSMHRQTNAHLAKLGITADQFVCLVILAEEDGITQNELVQRATSDPNTVRAMLLLLEKRGFVERRAHPTDGRARRVTLTGKGRDIYGKSMMKLIPVHDRLMAPFPAGETRILVRYLERILKAMTR